MFIKETGYIELICYAKYAGVDLDPEIYPQIQYSDEQIQQIIKENWNTKDAEYDRLMKIGKYFQLYPSEIYVIFLSVLPFWDSRFGNIFSLFGGIDGRATLVLARDMWKKNHKQQAICRAFFWKMILCFNQNHMYFPIYVVFFQKMKMYLFQTKKLFLLE